MSTLLQHLPFDLQKEVGRFDHANKLKEVHEDLEKHTTDISYAHMYCPRDDIEFCKYMITPRASDIEVFSYSWTFFSANVHMPSGYAYHSVKDVKKIRKTNIESEMCRVKSIINKLKASCTKNEWENISSEIETSLK
jgi:hypothetical protein